MAARQKKIESDIKVSLYCMNREPPDSPIIFLEF